MLAGEVAKFEDEKQRLLEEAEDAKRKAVKSAVDQNLVAQKEQHDTELVRLKAAHDYQVNMREKEAAEAKEREVQFVEAVSE